MEVIDMALIMITSWYPLNKVKEVAAKFLEGTRKYPQASYEKVLVSAVSSTKKGLRTIWITEIEEGKLDDGLKIVTKRLVEYFGIEGYTYKLETLMTLQEAMPMIGLAMPT
jgi:hypothetical protein